MSSAPPPPLAQGHARSAILGAGALGLVVSWAVFAQWGADHGWSPSSFIDFWVVAVTQRGISGLTWDLVACGLITSVLAVHRRAAIGGARGVAIVLGLTWTLGVCVGLLALVGLDKPRSDRP